MPTTAPPDMSSGIAQLLLPLLSPTLILTPLVVVLALRNRHPSDPSAAEKWHRGLIKLAICTLAALVVWGGCVVASESVAGALWAARFAWILFFPLWFVLTMPLLWLKLDLPNRSCEAMAGDQTTLRTASLVNRERQSPVQGWMWAIAVASSLAGASLILARGLLPFPREALGVDPTEAAETERLIWLVFLGVALLSPMQLLWLPRLLSSMLLEPEPLDTAGSQQLVDLYANHRRRRVLSMFWIMGVAGPLILGTVYALAVWYPTLGARWGVVGGLAGTLLGVLGAINGFMMTARRAEIDQFRARLDRGDPALQSR